MSMVQPDPDSNTPDSNEVCVCGHPAADHTHFGSGDCSPVRASCGCDRFRPAVSPTPAEAREDDHPIRTAMLAYRELVRATRSTDSNGCPFEPHHGVDCPGDACRYAAQPAAEAQQPEPPAETEQDYEVKHVAEANAIWEAALACDDGQEWRPIAIALAARPSADTEKLRRVETLCAVWEAEADGYSVSDYRDKAVEARRRATSLRAVLGA